MKTGSDGLCKRCLASLSYPVVERGIRWSLSGIFIYSGLMKLMDPQRFAEVISGFGLLPHALIFPAAILLPILEVVAGVGLVFSLRGSLPLSRECWPSSWLFSCTGFISGWTLIAVVSAPKTRNRLIRG